MEDECVKSNTAKVKKETSYTIIEKIALKVNCQQEIEVEDSSEALGDIKNTLDCNKVNVEELFEPHRRDLTP